MDTIVIETEKDNKDYVSSEYKKRKAGIDLIYDDDQLIDYLCSKVAEIWKKHIWKGWIPTDRNNHTCIAKPETISKKEKHYQQHPYKRLPGSKPSEIVPIINQKTIDPDMIVEVTPTAPKSSSDYLTVVPQKNKLKSGSESRLTQIQQYNPKQFVYHIDSNNDKDKDAEENRTFSRYCEIELVRASIYGCFENGEFVGSPHLCIKGYCTTQEEDIYLHSNCIGPIEDFYICKYSGLEHLCGSKCKANKVLNKDNLVTCPISGINQGQRYISNDNWSVDNNGGSSNNLSTEDKQYLREQHQEQQQSLNIHLPFHRYKKRRTRNLLTGETDPSASDSIDVGDIEFITKNCHNLGEGDIKIKSMPNPGKLVNACLKKQKNKQQQQIDAQTKNDSTNNQQLALTSTSTALTTIQSTSNSIVLPYKMNHQPEMKVQYLGLSTIMLSSFFAASRFKMDMKREDRCKEYIYESLRVYLSKMTQRGLVPSIPDMMERVNIIRAKSFTTVNMTRLEDEQRAFLIEFYAKRCLALWYIIKTKTELGKTNPKAFPWPEFVNSAMDVLQDGLVVSDFKRGTYVVLINPDPFLKLLPSDRESPFLEQKRKQSRKVNNSKKKKSSNDSINNVMSNNKFKKAPRTKKLDRTNIKTNINIAMHQAIVLYGVHPEELRTENVNFETMDNKEFIPLRGKDKVVCY
jgi:ribosomal protein S10